MSNTTSSSTTSSIHFLYSTAGRMHFITAFLKHWDGVSIWVTPSFYSREEAMSFVKPNLNTSEWELMKACTIEQGRKYYSKLIKGGDYKPVKP